MTSQKLKRIRQKLGLSQRGLAFWLNPRAKNMDREVRRWESGSKTIPGYIETIVLMFDDGAVPRHMIDDRC